MSLHLLEISGLRNTGAVKRVLRCYVEARRSFPCHTQVAPEGPIHVPMATVGASSLPPLVLCYSSEKVVLRTTVRLRRQSRAPLRETELQTRLLC